MLAYVPPRVPPNFYKNDDGRHRTDDHDRDRRPGHRKDVRHRCSDKMDNVNDVRPPSAGGWQVEYHGRPMLGETPSDELSPPTVFLSSHLPTPPSSQCDRASPFCMPATTGADPVGSNVIMPSPRAPATDRLARIAADNGLDVAQIRHVWKTSRANVKEHLFDPATGVPRFILSIEIWKPLVRAYFAWCEIPRESCTDVWGDIVDMLLRLPQLKMVDAEFRAWAFGCLAMFHLEDKKLNRYTRRPISSASYDPDENWKIKDVRL